MYILYKKDVLLTIFIVHIVQKVLKQDLNMFRPKFNKSFNFIFLKLILDKEYSSIKCFKLNY